MNFNPGNIIGKTVNACISRPGPGQMSRIYMMMFTDGSCYEFVSGKTPTTLVKRHRNSHRDEFSSASAVESGTYSRQLSLSGF